MVLTQLGFIALEMKAKTLFPYHYGSYATL